MMDLKRVLQAMLFVSDQPMRADQLAEILSDLQFESYQFDLSQIPELLRELQEELANGDQPFELKNINQGWQIYTKEAFYPFLRHSIYSKNRKKLSRAALETLSIIAYRQPVTKSEVEFIRGVNCDYTVRMLLEKNLIEIGGRSDAAGRPLLYITSDQFMEFFGLNDISDLPKLKEFEVDEEEYQMQFKVYLKEQDHEEEEEERAEAGEGDDA